MYVDMLSSGELAAMRLKNLMVSRQAIEQKAKKEAWPYQELVAQGRGGKVKKYIVSQLPTAIQQAIQERQAAELMAQSATQQTDVATQQKPLTNVLALNDKQSQCAHARMSVVAEVLKMHRVAGLSLKAAIAYVIEQLETGRLPEHLVALVKIANNRANGKARVSARTLMTWCTLYQRANSANERLMALSPKKTREQVAIAQYTWLATFASFHCRPSAPKLTHSYAAFADWWVNNMPINDLPSIDTVRRVWHRLPIMMQERGRKTGAAYKALLPYVKRDWSVLKPNEAWIGDGHSFKAKVAHPIHGRPFKPEVTFIIDGCTRMIVGFSFALAESCVAVSDALRIGMKHHGVPLIYYSDNGGGQTGKTIDHEITGLCARLGIHHETGLPGNPQGRGIIERLWKDTLIKLAREYETFVGAGMDSSTQNLMYRRLESAFNAEDKGHELSEQQKRFKAKLPSWQQFQADVMKLIVEYNHRPHSSLPRHTDGQHYSPIEYRDMRMAEGNLVADVLAEEELDTLFRPQEIRKVQRGWLDLFGNSYFSHDLAAHHKGEVRVAYDYDDCSEVMVFDLDGAFLCKAQLDGNKRAAFGKTVREQQADKRAKGRIKRAEQVIKLANAEKQMVIEQNTFDELLIDGLQEVLTPLAQRTGTDDIQLFATDLED